MIKADIGVIGLGVMGHNLALNIERNGFTVAGYDLNPQATEHFLATDAAGKRIAGASSPAELAAMLEKPRRLLMMVPAGAPVDSVITLLKPFLEPGDILIDGGNSFFEDTARRGKALLESGIYFVGMGVSGGAEGALMGPSLMPGGPREAWSALEPILQAIAAKAAEDGLPCVAYMGPGGSGHYVKMVHNGIEYGVMQSIAEAYDLLLRGLGLSPREISAIFGEWNEGPLHSYLVQITAEILAAEDPLTGKPLVNVILDAAEQKGTGEWTAQDALDIGAPTPTINAAVESRMLSSLKAQRVQASQTLPGPLLAFDGDRNQMIEAVRDALLASMIISYAQGFGMLCTASDEYGYHLDLAEIARIWRAGCIIRARLLNEMMDAFQRRPELPNLLLDEDFRAIMAKTQAGWRLALCSAVQKGIPVPAMSTSLAYYDAYRSSVLPANLIQAQRDFFGAHGYRRVDREGVFHTDWTGAA